MGAKPGHKYHAIKTNCGVHDHPSKKEANRCQELRLLERGGEIQELEFQPRFGLRVHGNLICTYVADFRYFDARTGQIVIEDTKGVKTPVYRIKKKLMEALYGAIIAES